MSSVIRVTRSDPFWEKVVDAVELVQVGHTLGITIEQDEKKADVRFIPELEAIQIMLTTEHGRPNYLEEESEQDREESS